MPFPHALTPHKRVVNNITSYVIPESQTVSMDPCILGLFIVIGCEWNGGVYTSSVIASMDMLMHPPLHWAQSLPNASVYLVGDWCEMEVGD